MAKNTRVGKSLIAVQQELGTEQQCLAFLEALRWPDGVRCVECDHDKVSKFVTKEGSRERVTVAIGGGPPDADPQRMAGVHAHRLEHGRRLDALGRAGGARMDGDAGAVQPDEHGLGFDAEHAEAHQMGEPALRAGTDNGDPLDGQRGVSHGSDLSAGRCRFRRRLGGSLIFPPARSGATGGAGSPSDRMPSAFFSEA